MRSSRRGFTLVEVLTAIAIISVLVGLLVPAVQQARRAAARMKSQNNLKQIALATHHHHDAHSKLPYYHSLAEESSTPGHHTAHWRILPYLEQGNLVAAVEADLRHITYTPVATFLDPTDPTVLPDQTQHRCSYVFNMQVTGYESRLNFWVDARTLPIRYGPEYGPWYEGRPLPPPSPNSDPLDDYAIPAVVHLNPNTYPGAKTLLGVTDGTSNTILLTQRFNRCGTRYSNPLPCWFASPNSPMRAVYAPDLLPQLGIRIDDCIGGAAQTVNSSILVALCDGSVRSVSAGGVANYWFAASTPAGGEVIPGDW